MDTKRAFDILGLNSQSSPDEIEERFRTLTNQHHPDHGGTNESMAELNDARSVALQAFQAGTNLVPLEALNAAITAVSIRQEERQALERRVENMRKHLHSRSTRKYRRNRRIAGIFAAIAAAAIFLRQEIPTDMFYPVSSGPDFTIMASEEQEEYNRLRAEPDPQFAVMWNVMFFGIAIYSGLIAWFFTSRIEKVNRDLENLEEQLGTKTLLHLFLQEILGEKIRTKWTLNDMAESISLEETVPQKYRYVARQIGSLRFAQFLIDRALQLSLISVHDELVQNDLVEYYIVTVYGTESS